MIDFGNSYFIILLAGVAFILFGMSTSSHALEKIMANRISGLMHKLSESNFLAIVVGISLTTILQSSGAVTSMLVGLGSARVIALQQVMGVIIGTAIGSALTVQLISFNLGSIAFPLFSIAFLFYFVAKKPSIKNIALVFIGFSMMFMGMGMIHSSAHHFTQNELLADAFATLRSSPIMSLVASMVFCAVVQSSAVTIGIAMSLVAANAISFYDAMFWVYGANIGTTSIALFAAAGSNYIGRQVAWAHFFYKTISVIIFYPLTNYLIKVIDYFGSTPSRMVANGHLLFNIFSAVAFYPFIRKGAQIIEKMFPKGEGEEFGTEFLKLDHYQSSALATSYANREILRTADIVLSMVSDSVKLFNHFDPILVESIKDRDNKVDFLYREIKMFLLDHANKSNNAVHQDVMKMIMFLSDLERAADAIDINILGLAIKKNALKLEFSDEGWHELRSMHEQVMRAANMAVNAFNNRELCESVVQLKRELAKIEMQYRENHVYRLNKGLRDSINTSSIHLDLLSEYKRITGLMCNHAYK